MWLVAHDKSQKVLHYTADRLARRGLLHLELCSLCDQTMETVNRLLTSCVFAQYFWFHLFQKFVPQTLSPQLEYVSFTDWWARAEARMNGRAKKGLNSIIILRAWTFWKHCNRCDFDGDLTWSSRGLTGWRKRGASGRGQGLFLSSCPLCRMVIIRLSTLL